MKDAEELKNQALSKVSLVFPNQLFEQSPLIDLDQKIYLIEEELFFKQYQFHKQKIAFHRASMRAYLAYLKNKGLDVQYVNAIDEQSSIAEFITYLSKQEHKEIHYINPVDNYLERRLKSAAKKHKLGLKEYSSPSFINTKEDLSDFFRADKKKFFQTKFYIQQRKKEEILLDKNGEAEGGKWSFDSENRKKYPKKKKPPEIQFPNSGKQWKDAVQYVSDHFESNPGKLAANQIYPIDFDGSKNWLNQFLKERFHDFGDYEDAIFKDETFLNHSVISPLLNSGLLTPRYVLDEALKYAKKNDVPINSLEGFVRQIMGWREFIRGIYTAKGSQERTTNYWGFNRKMPASFYDGTTGIEPFDTAVKKVLKTGYCHHIERLMVIGNFMVLCEIDPDDVYQWFMELFIDAYDWVMVPNVYGMSQFADGGLMSTKPYISGSNYIMKMSNYGKGNWQETWDALFWRFMHVHRDFFSSNPRLGMLLGTYDKMSKEKQQKYLNDAEQYLNSLAHH